jgi:hypothetical protein
VRRCHRNSLGRKPLREHVTVLRNGPEDWTFRDTGMVKPGVEGRDWADRSTRVRDCHLATKPFLVGLALADGDENAGGPALDRLTINRNQLRPAEGPGEADQQQCPVADIPSRIAQR